MSETIRVAIIGGGLMGCTLANGLLRHTNVDWHIFEGKPNLVERGASVGFRDNGVKALAAMGLDYEGMFRRVGAVVSDESHCMVAHGERKGDTVSKLPAGHINLMRTRWLEELLAPLSKDKLHLPTADAVIGCDGIHSTVRGLVLHEHPDLIAPRFGGYWDARGLCTPEEATKRLGNDLFDPSQSSEIALTGNGAFMLFCPSESGSEYAVIISAAAKPDFDATSWKTPFDRDFLESAFQGWDTSFRDAVIDCIVADGSGAVFSQWMTPETPTYCRCPGLCIAGDAAHSMLPFMGNGAALAMEDAAVLSALLGACRTRADVWPALKSFDRSQREIGESMVEKSQVAAQLMTGQLGLPPENVATIAPNRWWEEIIKTDVEKNVHDALLDFDQLRASY